MSRRAVWRRVPDDPRTALGWLWDDRVRYLRAMRSNLAFYLGFLALVLYFHGYLMLASGALATTILLLRLRARPRSVESLLTLPAPVPSFVCDLDIRRAGTTIGIDRGVVSFVDGWLHFEGRRTSFAVKREDLKARESEKIELTDGTELLFRSQVENGLLHPSRWVFGVSLEAWARKGSAEGESLLPPTAPHPSALYRASRDLLFAALGVIALAWGGWAFGPFALVVLLFGFTGSMIDAVVEYKAQRRLEKEERRSLVAGILPLLPAPTVEKRGE